MKIKAVVSTVVALFAVGCAKSDSDKSSDTNSPPVVEKVTSVDTTDRSMCKGASPAKISLLSSSWYAKATTNYGVDLERVVRFSKDTFAVQITATYKDVTKSAKLESKIKLGAKSFEVLSDDYVEDSIMVEGKVFKFGFESRAATIKYTFVGPCLKITDSSGREAISVPVSKK